MASYLAGHPAFLIYKRVVVNNTSTLLLDWREFPFL